MLFCKQERVKIDNFIFDNEPLIEVVLTKNIKETVVPGRSGTVKELICINDADITISGVITPPSGFDLGLAGILLSKEKERILNEKVAKLNELFKLSDRLAIESELLNSLSIEHVVITELSLLVREGIDWQPYILRLKEDQEVMDFE